MIANVSLRPDEGVGGNASGVENLKPRGLWYWTVHLSSGPSSGNRTWVIEPSGFLNLNPHSARGTSPPLSVTTRPIPGAASSFGVKSIVLTPSSFVLPFANTPGRSNRTLPCRSSGLPETSSSCQATSMPATLAASGMSKPISEKHSASSGLKHLVVDGLDAEVHRGSLAGEARAAVGAPLVQRRPRLELEREREDRAVDTRKRGEDSIERFERGCGLDELERFEYLLGDQGDFRGDGGVGHDVHRMLGVEIGVRVEVVDCVLEHLADRRPMGGGLPELRRVPLATSMDDRVEQVGLDQLELDRVERDRIGPRRPRQIEGMVMCESEIARE